MPKKQTIFMYTLLIIVGAIVIGLWGITPNTINAQDYPYPGKSGNASSSSPVFNDGRIIDSENIAVFTSPRYPIIIYSINPETSEGWPTAMISAGEINKLGVPSEGSILIIEVANYWTGQPILLYRLSTGEFQLNTYDSTGKLFEYIWE